ncbi:anaerobic ribonucleoside-triphosphate reductase activating protein [Methanobrevibacter curvatus]|uniref:Pyruvate formate-lyase 1-activating enzyme n=1 Tax=Methanobrevibacter curvatus TaxID=49547 RepID=A0A166CMZ4_9EURY|nr:anaerobic ribonucleoside-triphosphate reductase activating protein [Methanobrevibacter curvatus]KZX14680.1 pyruvate formate-lyase 1-activating enzyme [Methanobrevibacter curvatus]
MKFGGSVLSSIEFSGRISLVIFLGGCPLNCPYCHNYELIDGGEEIDLSKVYKLIDENVDYIDALVVSGGEPLFQIDNLKAILEYTKAYNLETKLDTSGIYPKRLKKILNLIDYISLDIKAPFNKYKKVIGSDIGNKVKESMNIINDDIYTFLECRTTYSPIFLSKEDLKEIAKEISCDIFTIQQFRSKNVLDEKLKDQSSPNPLELKEIAIELKSYFKNIRIKSSEFGLENI